MIGLSAIAGLFQTAGGIVDSLHTSEEEKLKLKNTFFELQGRVLSDVLSYERSLNEAQSKVITAEASSGSWLTRSWRPITMLTFVALIVLRWVGLSASGLTEALELELFGIVKICIGGYVIGRSAEQAMKAGAQALAEYKK